MILFEVLDFVLFLRNYKLLPTEYFILDNKGLIRIGGNFQNNVGTKSETSYFGANYFSCGRND